MIEEVLHVGPKRCGDTVSEVEIFMNTQIHSPRPGPIQKVALGKVGITEYVGTNRRKIKRIRVPDLVTASMIHVAGDHRPVRGPIEVSNSIHRRDADIA